MHFRHLFPWPVFLSQAPLIPFKMNVSVTCLMANLGELLVLSCTHMGKSGDKKCDFQNNPGMKG
jgi:hypothetical protein